MKFAELRRMAHDRAHRSDLYSTAEYWDAKAAGYDGEAISGWPNNNLNLLYHREHTELLDRMLPSIRGSKILEVGCGTGRITRHLAERGADVVGIDFSQRAVDIARSQSVGGPEYRVQSLFDISEEDAYDVIVAWGVLVVACRKREELLDALRRLRRALRTGGTFVLLEPIHTGFLRFTLDMNVATFQLVMAEAGFRVVSIEQLHFWPMRFLLAYVQWPMYVTGPIYRLGQRMLRMPGLRAFGDYKGILAV